MASRRPRLQVRPNIAVRTSNKPSGPSNSPNQETSCLLSTVVPSQENREPTQTVMTQQPACSDSSIRSSEGKSLSCLQSEREKATLTNGEREKLVESSMQATNEPPSSVSVASLRSRFARVRPNLRSAKPTANGESNTTRLTDKQKETPSYETQSLSDLPSDLNIVPTPMRISGTALSQGKINDLMGNGDQTSANAKVLDTVGANPATQNHSKAPTAHGDKENHSTSVGEPTSQACYTQSEPNLTARSASNQPSFKSRYSRPKPIIQKPSYSTIKATNDLNASGSETNDKISKSKHVSFSGLAQGSTSVETDDALNTEVFVDVCEHSTVTENISSDENLLPMDVIPCPESQVPCTMNSDADVTVEVEGTEAKRQSVTMTKQPPSTLVRRFSKPRPNLRDRRRYNSGGMVGPRTESEAQVGHIQQSSGQTSADKAVPVTSNTADLQHSSRSTASLESSLKLGEKRQLAKINETKELMAQKRKQFTRCKGTPDRSKLTMIDLIYFNPPDNPIRSDEASLHKTEIILESDVLNESSENPDTDVPKSDVNDKDDDEEVMPGPRVRVGENGEIILDEESLVVKRCHNDVIGPTVYENTSSGALYTSFRKTSLRAKKWTPKETARFYKALSIIGTDFTLISQLFPNRSRGELKKKFKYEEKVHRTLIDNVINHSLNFAICTFDDDSLSEDSDVENGMDATVCSSEKVTKPRSGKHQMKGAHSKDDGEQPRTNASRGKHDQNGKRKRGQFDANSRKGKQKGHKQQQKLNEVADADGDSEFVVLPSLKMYDLFTCAEEGRPRRKIHKKVFDPDVYEDGSTMDSDALEDQQQEESVNIDPDSDETAVGDETETEIDSLNGLPISHLTGDSNSSRLTKNSHEKKKQNLNRHALLASSRPISIIPDTDGQLANLLQLPTLNAPPSMPSLSSLAQASPPQDVRGQLVFMRSETPGHEAVVHIYLIAPPPTNSQSLKGINNHAQSTSSSGGTPSACTNTESPATTTSS